MSAASPARTQVREAAPVSVPSRAAQAAPAAAPKATRPAGLSFAGANTEDQFKLHLSDIPRMPQTMEVEGFKPSLLARLVSKIIGN